MNEIIKNILNKIEYNGYVAYVVGGFVRDLLLGKCSNDVDICTNATPKELNNIFSDLNLREESYGSIRIRQDNFNFDITTFRSEKKYDDRKPIIMDYINDIEIDLKRRDFTINSILMNSNGDIIDYLNGVEDVKKGIICSIGDSNIKFKEDPLRMLRAIRFASTLNFKLDIEIINTINNNKYLIKNLSFFRKKEELDKILVNENYQYGVSLIKEFDLENILDIKIANLKYTNDLSGMWSQIEYSPKYIFKKEEIKNINIIRQILQYGTIDKYILYKYGLYISIVAGNILGLTKRKINIMYKSLPIKNLQDIDLSTNDIMNILNIGPSKIIKNVIMEIEKEIIKGNIINKKNVLINYIKDNKEVFINDKK